MADYSSYAMGHVALKNWSYYTESVQVKDTYIELVKV
jgi:hypothetical protein